MMIMIEDNGADCGADADSDGGDYKQDGSDHSSGAGYGSGGDNSADYGGKDKNCCKLL